MGRDRLAKLIPRLAVPLQEAGWPVDPYKSEQLRSGLLEKSNRGLASKVVSQISSLLPQLAHNLAIRQRCFSTFDYVKDAHLPGAHCD